MAPAKVRGRSVPLLLGIIVCGALPPAGYWCLFGRVPSMTPAEAVSLLKKPDSRLLLVDVRPPEAYKARHLEGAESWPYEEVLALTSSRDVPERFRDRPLAVTCESGLYGALAVRRLRELSVDKARNVEGGLQTWFGSAGQATGSSHCKLRTASGELEPLPSREMSLFEQWLAVLSGFVIKPAYSLLALVLIVALWRQAARDLVSLRWGLICFFAGETFCAANYVLYGEGSAIFEYLHSYGMVLAFSFTAYAFSEGLDVRVIHFSAPEKKCAALSLCRSCIKHNDAPCGLRRLFLFLIPALAVLALMPFGAVPDPVSYNTRILGTPYNYTHFVPHQLFEIRYCPALAVLLLTGAFLVLALKKHNPVPLASLLLAAGIGPLAFGLFRLFLLAAYRENLVWFVFWEELTELIYVFGTGVVLWLFRPALLSTR